MLRGGPTSTACARPGGARAASCRTARRHTAVAQAATRVPTVEQLLLFRQPSATSTASTDAEEDLLFMCVERLWALQYQVPGVICATAATSAALAPPDPPSCVSTHLLHYRFSSTQACDTFQSHPVFQDAYGAATAQADAVLHVRYSGSVQNSLETIFRRGDAFEGGAELLHTFSGRAGVAAAECELFLDRFAQLTESSAGGAVQCSWGRVLSSSDTRVQYSCLTRFPSAGVLRAFQALPVYQALVGGDSRLPVAAIACEAFDVATADDSNTQNR